MTKSREPLIVIGGGINRRKFIKYGSMALGTGILAAYSGAQSSSESASSSGSSPAASGEDVIKVGVMYKDAGITADQIPIMAYPTTEEEILAMGPEYAAGHYTSFNYFQTVDTPENKAFVEQFKAKFGQDRVTNGVMEAAYLQTFFMAQAMEKILDEGKEITVENLREATRGHTPGLVDGSQMVRQKLYFQPLLLSSRFLGVKLFIRVVFVFIQPQIIGAILFIKETGASLKAE